LPLTPPKIWRALQAKAEEQTKGQAEARLKTG